MKTKLALLTLGLSAAMASSAFAGDIKPLHTVIQAGLLGQSLGASATAKDIYQVTCPIDTRYYKARVRDQTPVMKPIVNVKIVGASTMTDTVDANGGTTNSNFLGFSSYSSRDLGSASATTVNFTIEVWKTAGTQGGAAPATADGAETYSVDEHCLGANGTTDLGSGTNLQVIQNQ
ncbi:MAG: hypothetical protein IPN42_02855 [Methylococcaceae bacterium]|nr:hypothetical protein [Methylococcaceae bacterium]